MKLLTVTVVKQFQNEVVQLFKKAKIKSFSGIEPSGYEIVDPLLNHFELVAK